MAWKESGIPKTEPREKDLKKELNEQIVQLIKKGTSLERIVEFLGAENYLTQITKKGQSLVAHFDVDGFIKKRISKERPVRLPEQFIVVDEVFVPAQEGQIITGSGNGFEGRIIEPRSELLMELMAEMDFRYSIAEGNNDPKMFRKISYKVFILPEKGKLVFVSDEKGNATFIIHNAQPEELQKYTKMKKEELNASSESQVSVVRYPKKEGGAEEKKWKEQIRELISNGSRERVFDVGAGEAPEEWRTPLEIAKTAEFDIETVENIAAASITENSDLAKKFLNKNKQRTLYFSPELVKIIEADLGKRERVPEGWMTKRGIAGLLDVDFRSIERIANEHKKVHPEWFRDYRSTTGNMRTHLSPELIEIIRKDVEKRKTVPLAPEGWQTRRSVADTNGLTFRSIDKEAEKLREYHPEWFQKYMTGNDRVMEFLHPDLIRLIIETHKILESAPPGWMTTGAIGREIKISIPTVQSRAEKFRLQHPEWFKKYRHPRGQQLEFLSPELVEIIKKAYTESKLK